MRILCHRQTLPRDSECPSHHDNACIFREVRPKGAIGSCVSFFTRFRLSHTWDTITLSQARDSVVPNFSNPCHFPDIARQAGQIPLPRPFLSGVMARVRE